MGDNRRLFIAVDLGAGSGRVFLAGFAPQELLLEEVRRFRYPPRSVDGHLRWDARHILAEITDGLREAAARARVLQRPIHSVGIDCWGVDYGLVDGAGSLLEDPVCYRDARTDGMMDAAFERVPRAEMFARTGIQFMQLNTVFQVFAHVKEGLPTGAARLLLVPDLMGAQLCGRAVTEFSIGTTTQMFNASTGTWDDELLRRLGIPRDLLCDVVPSGTTLGSLLPEVVAETGLSGVDLVATAAHDTASAVAGAPLRPGWAYISSGTWSLAGVERPGVLINDEVARHNFTNEGGVFGTTRFLKNVMGLWILESCRREWIERGQSVDYDDLLLRAAAIDGDAGLIYPDDPRFLNPPSMLAAIADQMRESGQAAPTDPPAVAKVILDSLAHRYAFVFRTIEQLTGTPIEGVQIIGGGSQNGYLNQATATATGKPVLAGPIEATATGNAVVQAIAAGRFASLADARAHVARHGTAHILRAEAHRSLGPRSRPLCGHPGAVHGRTHLMSKNIDQAYRLAAERYQEFGVDTEGAMARLKTIPVSLHCWQGDDVRGFEQFGGELTGGIAATGNYPGAARTPDQLRADATKALSLIPGRHRFNLHAFYGDFGGARVDRDEIRPEHFAGWIDWAKSLGIGLDFNPTYFSHPNAADNMTLSHPDEGIRAFWVRHGIACRTIAEAMGRALGKTCVTNFWIPDGMKDTPVDRKGPRERLIGALDAIFKKPIDPACNLDAVEGKLFGIGVESYTVGSHEFYLAYALTRRILFTLDTGHYHPTETITDKISSVLSFAPEILLHVSRGVRWDSDHVVILNDDLEAIGQELVRGDYLARTHIGLDYFDASINRVAAWTIGVRNMLKALLKALIEPIGQLRAAEQSGDYTGRLALLEEAKTLPFGAVWDYYCQASGVPVGEAWLADVRTYERDVLSLRK